MTATASNTRSGPEFGSVACPDVRSPRPWKSNHTVSETTTPIPTESWRDQHVERDKTSPHPHRQLNVNELSIDCCDPPG
jgi:hypothetical protein